jgi:hypothetical protein
LFFATLAFRSLYGTHIHKIKHISLRQLIILINIKNLKSFLLELKFIFRIEK